MCPTDLALIEYVRHHSHMTVDESVPRFLTAREVAARYRTAPSTLRHWRRIGYGPKGVKVGRHVLYSETELQRFEESQS
jgi:hypothetical protein